MAPPPPDDDPTPTVTSGDSTPPSSQEELLQPPGEETTTTGRRRRTGSSRVPLEDDDDLDDLLTVSVTSTVVSSSVTLPSSVNSIDENLNVIVAEVEEKRDDEDETTAIGEEGDVNNNKKKKGQSLLSRVMRLPLPEDHPPAEGMRRPLLLIYTVFGDLARAIGLARSRKVRFPADVIAKSYEKGETSPDSGTIPIDSSAYRPAYSFKKSTIIKASKSGRKPFKCRIEWIGTTTKCELACEECAEKCECCAIFKDPNDALLIFRSKKKPLNLTTILDSFMCNLNIADQFIAAHKKNTLYSALCKVDGYTEWPPQGREPDDPHLFLSIDELPPLNHAKLGVLSSFLWIFGACIPLLFKGPLQSHPTEKEFKSIILEFAMLSQSANNASRDLLEQSRDFHNYAAENLRVFKELQHKIELDMDTTSILSEPLSIGGGLQFLPDPTVTTSASSSPQSPSAPPRPPFDIYVAKGYTASEETLTFEKFETLSSHRKVHCLKRLVSGILVEFNHAKHQIDFLVDDIIETTIDMKNNQDLLYRLSEMYQWLMQVYVQYVRQNNYDDDSEATRQMQHVITLLKHFLSSLITFIKAAEHVMEKLMEVRDMVQLTCYYLHEEERIDIASMVPLDSEARRDFRRILRGGWCRRCCGHKKKAGKMKIKNFALKSLIPNYRGTDFYRVRYEELFVTSPGGGNGLCREIDVAEGYVFRVVRKPDDPTTSPNNDTTTDTPTTSPNTTTNSSSPRRHSAGGDSYLLPFRKEERGKKADNDNSDDDSENTTDYTATDTTTTTTSRRSRTWGSGSTDPASSSSRDKVKGILKYPPPANTDPSSPPAEGTKKKGRVSIGDVTALNRSSRATRNDNNKTVAATDPAAATDGGGGGVEDAEVFRRDSIWIKKEKDREHTTTTQNNRQQKK